LTRVVGATTMPTVLGMRAAWHRWLRSAASVRVAAALLVVVLSLVGFVVTTRAVDADRHAAADRQADTEAQQLQGLLERAGTFGNGLGNALAGEHAPDGRRFAALVGSSTATIGLTRAMWVESVSAGGRRAYEDRIGNPITKPPGGRPAPAAKTYLPATFSTGALFRRGADMSYVPALANTLRNPASVFAGTATSQQVVAGQSGFFLVQGAHFGRGPRSRGFLVIFVPAGWPSQTLNQDPQRTAISLDGRLLAGTPSATRGASRRFDALTQPWRVSAAPDQATALQATVPRVALAWPPATAVLVYLIGRGMLRRRRAEREVDDIFDLSLDLLCIVGVDGYLKRVNPAFERTLGYDSAELLTRPLLEFVHPDDRDATTTSLARLREGHRVEPFESRYVRADGAFRWLQWNTRPLLERGLMYAAAHDVTDNRMLLDEQAALRRVATLVAQGPDAGDLFTAVAVEVGQLLGADATRLLRYEPDGSVSVVAGHGASDADIGVRAAPGHNPSHVWRRVAQRASSAGADRQGDGSGRLAVDGQAPGIGASVAAPIVVSGRDWGVIVAAWKHADLPRADTEARIEKFTELVATAVANAESRAELAASRRRIVETADETRQRIERDLHDGAQQRLVSTILTLRAAQMSLGDGSESAAVLVERALESIESANEELRELSRGIHPAILRKGGLVRALKMVARRSSVPVTLDVPTDVRLPEHTEVTAYFVISEALTNAVKHSRASTLRVAVEAVDGELQISVGDDGVGGADPARGSGLIGLRDRVEAAGGTLAIQSPPGKGTHLTVKLPIPAP